MNQEIIKKAEKIIIKNTGEATYCSLALMDLDGYPTVSTISASKAEGINWITFCTGLSSPRIRRIEKCKKASVCVTKFGYN